MRWLSFLRDGNETFGYVVVDSDGSEGVVDAGARSEFVSLREAIAADALTHLTGSCGDQADVSLPDIDYLPTITDPAKIMCVGLNYKAHQEETGRGGEGYPTIFVRFADAQMGHNAPMIRPLESTSLDFEGEIALIIGRAGRRIKPADAMSHVAGFSIYNDGSVRDYQRQTSQFTPGKNFASTGGFGPWMMTVDEIGDLDAMEITTRLNGEVMQNWNPEDMIFDVPALIEFLSGSTRLAAGTVILTGTPHGVGFARTPPVLLKDGDEVTIEIDGIGQLTNPVKDE